MINLACSSLRGIKCETIAFVDIILQLSFIIFVLSILFPRYPNNNYIISSHQCFLNNNLINLLLFFINNIFLHCIIKKENHIPSTILAEILRLMTTKWIFHLIIHKNINKHTHTFINFHFHPFHLKIHYYYNFSFLSHWKQDEVKASHVTNA